MTFSALRRDSRGIGRCLMHSMEGLWLLLLVFSYVTRVVDSVNAHQNVEIEDNEFAEFEDIEESVDSGSKSEDVQKETPPPGGGMHRETVSTEDVDEFEDEEEGVVEEEDEFAHLQDEDMFENFDRHKVDANTPGSKQQPQQTQELKFAQVPAHLRSNWSNYQVEMVMLVGLALYLINYAVGKTKNQTIAHAWFENNRDFLTQQFAIVGDDGSSPEPQQGVLLKETDSQYSVWCSGRNGCVGMLMQLKLIKRQDLFSMAMNLVRPKSDRIIIKVELDAGEMDSYVFAVGPRKHVTKLFKEMMDLSVYCSEKKNADKFGLPSSYTMMSEIAEATQSMLDPKVIAMINKFEDNIEYFHFSDQFTGPKPQEGETQAKITEPSRVLIFSFCLSDKTSAEQIDQLRPLMSLVFHCVEKARRLKLTKEGKQKADKNRQSVAETFLKTTHQARQEAAQIRREDRIRERKQKVLEETDPEKQRRLENQEKKREAKKKTPKMKQLKIKAM